MFVAFPSRYLDATMDGLKLWLTYIVPSTLPFFFFATILSKIGAVAPASKLLSPITKRLFRTSGISSFVFTMSVLSGYPIAAKLVSEYCKKGLLSNGEAKRTLAFTSNSSVIFVVGTVGGALLGSVKLGLIIYAAHILSSLIIGLVFRQTSGEIVKECDLNANLENDIVYETAYDTAISLLVVGVIIAIFSVAAEMATDLKLLYPLEALIGVIFPSLGSAADGITVGLLEVTGGLYKVAAQALGGDVKAVIFSFLISLGGASVALQSLLYLNEIRAGGFYLLIKVIHSVLAALIAALLLILF